MPDETPQATPKPTRKAPLKSVLILAAIMLLEGGVFVMWMVFTDPSGAAGAMDTALATSAASRTSELPVLQFRAPNTQTGKLWLYDLHVVIEVPRERAGAVEKAVHERRAAIRDALSTLVRKADPQHLNEPKLDTLRRQIQVALTEILGEGAVESVLIPECTPYRADY